MSLHMSMTDQVLMPGADYLAICNAVRALTGGTAALTSGDIAGALAGVKRLTVQTGTVTPTADTNTLTVPVVGTPKLLTIRTGNHDPLTGSLLAVTSVDVVPNDTSPRNTKALVVQQNGAEGGFVTGATIADGGVTFEFSSTRVFVGGRTYNWTAYFWEDET